MAYPGDITVEQLTNVSAESLVTWVGVIDDGKGERTEEFRSRPLSTQLALIQRLPHKAQMAMYSQVSAKYLPALVDIWRQKEDGDALNSATLLINAISSSPYVIRFLRSPAGQGLAAMQAHRVATCNVNATSVDIDDMTEMTQFLSTLLMLQGVQDVAAQDKTALLQKLPGWAARGRGHLLEETVERCVGVLTNDPMVRMMMGSAKQMLCAPLDECGAPGCTKKKQEGGSDLLQCAKCKTAVYCGVSHQRAGWREHKPVCFSAVF